MTNTVSQVPIPKPPESGADQVLSQRASFWVAASVVMHTLWTSAAPAMTYPLYASEWHLRPTVTTTIFAIYPLVVVTVLIFFGDISDYIGRRTTMLIGLGASLIGVLLFAVAPSVYWIFLGRFFMGVGVGLSAAPSAAAMVEFSPAGQAGRAGSITTAAQALGLALALLVGGALIAYAPLPTRLNFWVLSWSSLQSFLPPGSCRVIVPAKRPEYGAPNSLKWRQGFTGFSPPQLQRLPPDMR
jgi:MFS family permease